MNHVREGMLKAKEKVDSELFEKIKDNPHPDALDLWQLSEERFIEWRKLNDFPVLLAHFDKTLTLFKEWKAEYKLTNELIIASGHITPFLENKKFAKKDKKLYLTKQQFQGMESTFVAYEKLEGQKESLGRTFLMEFILEFQSYQDWLKQRGKTQKILYINSRHSPDSNHERVFIHADVYAHHSDFELLKMGGMDAPVNGFGMLFRGKSMEFVNLCGLRFSGRISFGEEGNLNCSYCACDNWQLSDLDMPMMEFSHCSVNNMTAVNSKLQQWRFYDCNTSGDLYNTKLFNVNITGGHFNPVMLDCVLSDTNLGTDPNLPDHNLYGYKSFKKIYQAQGDDVIAQKYFIKENEFIRSRLKGWNYFTKSLSYYYWEYGRKPHRIIYFSFAVIFVFGLLFWLNNSLLTNNIESGTTVGFGDSLYFSTITFTTLGYGDISPHGWLKFFTSIESLFGVINTGFLIAGYSNTKY